MRRGKNVVDAKETRKGLEGHEPVGTAVAPEQMLGHRGTGALCRLRSRLEKLLHNILWTKRPWRQVSENTGTGSTGTYHGFVVVVVQLDIQLLFQSRFCGSRREAARAI